MIRLPPEFAEAAANTWLRPPPEFSPADLSRLDLFVKASGMRPEGQGGPRFSLIGRPYLEDLYRESRANPFRRIAIMKAAQMGLTVKLLYRAAWLVSDTYTRVNTALMFPTLEAVLDLQKSRFRPMFHSSAKMMRMVADVDSASLVRVGVSNLRFRGMKSGIGVDSFPADALLFDEVRLMDLATLERTFVRVSQSHFHDPRTGVRGIIELNSTAGFPNMDIHRWFLRSTQKYWATPCPNPSCKNHSRGIIMPLRWPDCVGKEGSRLYYRCPDCKTEIPDEVLLAEGFYQQTNFDTIDGEALWEGYQFSQILLGNRFLPELWKAWTRGDNLPEFYNSRLGLPYQDRDAIPAGREVVLACTDPEYRWPDPERLRGEWVAMGVDQRAPEKHAVIWKLGAGTFDLVHLEVLEASGRDAEDAIVRLAQRYHVKILVMDGEPSYDLAVGVARRLPKGVVWLADYVSEAAQPVQWKDERSRKDIAKSSGEVKYEYRVLLDRYKSMDWALTQFTVQRCRLPADFLGLTQPRTVGGVRQKWNVAEEYLLHLENIARATIPVYITLADGSKALTNEVRRVYRHLALDPHFAHANLYAKIGLSRRTGTSSISLGAELSDTPPPHQLNVVMPAGVRPADLEEQTKQALTRICGSCRYWKELSGDRGLCGYPGNAHMALHTPRESPGCPAYGRK